MKRKVSAKDFEIVKAPKELKNLTSQILYDLFDMAIKWGEPREDETVVLPALINGEGFIIMAVPESRGLFLSKKSEILGEEMFAPDKGALIVETRQKAPIIWDKRILVAEVIKRIREINEIAKEGGLINSKTGERIFWESIKNKPVKYKVSEVFRTPGYIFLVPPDISETPEQLLQQFDQPELLQIIEDGPLKVICLRSAKGLFNARKKVLEEIMAEREITEDDIGKMDEKELMGLKREIDERVQNSQNI